MRKTHLSIPLLVSWLSVTLMTTVTDAAGQDPGPIGPFVFDLRGALVGLSQNTDLANDRGLWPDQLAPRSVGLNVGGHAYVFRWREITFGVGISALVSSASRRLGTLTENGFVAPMPDLVSGLGPNGEGTTTEKDDPIPKRSTVKTRFSAISPELSFNFGDGDGWSYLSGGLGTSTMNVYPEQPTVPEQRRAGTLNYGGGARWFVKPNLAFSFDIRLFAISPLPELEAQPGSPRMTRFAVNLGLSVR